MEELFKLKVELHDCIICQAEICSRCSYCVKLLNDDIKPVPLVQPALNYTLFQEVNPEDSAFVKEHDFATCVCENCTVVRKWNLGDEKPVVNYDSTRCDCTICVETHSCRKLVRYPKSNWMR